MEVVPPARAVYGAVRISAQRASSDHGCERATRRRFPRFLPLALPAALIATLLGASVAFAWDVSNTSGACSSNGKSITGVVTSSISISTTITLDLQYKVGSTWTTYNTTTATFTSSNNNGKSAPYTMPFTSHTGATGYRIVYDAKNPKIINTNRPSTYTFSSCSGVTAAAFSRISVRVDAAQHVLRWYSAQRVLGYNVFAGHTRLNSQLITSSSHWYTFATNHSTTGARIVAVLAGGASR